ncbi:MAG: restriction endonuclease [Clostridia bacterium]|nr:restriction endonuclease [Clostridia bacterium]
MIEKEENNAIAKYQALIKETNVQKAELDKKLKAADNYSKNAIARVEEYISKKSEMYPHLAAIRADMLTQHYERSAQILEIKKRPALVEAKRIRELRRETMAVIAEKKVLEYQLEYIRTLFPNVDDIFDPAFEAADTMELETVETTDRTRLYLSNQEFNSLSLSERNQLALDRYLQRNKTKWQIGRDYELYIGYLCESNGYKVQYTGTLQKLEDMGRDLIVSDPSHTYIIQCKNWAQEKEIHEKHIFQLFGSIVQYGIEHPKLSLKAVFVTTTSLSEMAQKVANQLDIEVRYIKMGEFPRIKCNLGKDTYGTPTKIYHLPFDQQYDRVIIDKSKGECYAFTVAEAEEKGFRRAWKHFEK